MPNPATETIGTDHVVSEIFLTPRVIDAGAFGKYSAVLRELIESSVAASARLAAERERAEAAIEQAKSLPTTNGTSDEQPTSKTPQGSIDRAAAVRIARLEATVAELAGRLEQAEASASEAKSIARGEQGARGEMGDVIGSELTPEFDEALARAEAAEDRLRKLIGMAEQAGEELSERVGDVIGKAASSGAELTAMIMMLAEQIEKAEALGEIGAGAGSNTGSGKGAGDGASEIAAASPIDEKTLRSIGELIEHVSEAVRIATEKTETLESMNIRADASGEALLRAVRSATDGAVNAESIADRLTGLIARAEAIGARLTAPGAAASIPAEAAASHTIEPATENLAAGERLALGSMGPSQPDPRSDGRPSERSGESPTMPSGGRDLRSFAERAAAEPDATADSPSSGFTPSPTPPTISGPPPISRYASGPSRPFPPTPIDPSLVSKPQLRRPIRPIDAEDFGAAGAD